MWTDDVGRQEVDADDLATQLMRRVQIDKDLNKILKNYNILLYYKFFYLFP